MLRTARALAVALWASATWLSSTALAEGEYLPPANPPPPETIPQPSSVMANRGPQFGARIGYAFGTGIVYSGFSVNDGSHGAMPLILDLGWRFLPELYAGLYGQYAPVFTRTNDVECFAGFTCTTQDWRFGIEGDFHPIPRSRLDPYVGLGFGYEILHTKVSGPQVVPTPAGFVPGTVDVSAIDRGWEFGTLIVGFDGRIDPALGIGLFASASLNKYNIHTGTETILVDGTPVSSSPLPDVNHGFHEIYMVGVRGTINP